MKNRIPGEGRILGHGSVRSGGYLREPASFYLSSAQQVLKYGRGVQDPAVALRYCEKLGKLDAALPGRVTSRAYARPALFRGDVSLDLLSQFMAPDAIDALGIEPVTSNSSLSAEAMAFLATFNNHVWGDHHIVGNPVNKRLISLIEAEERRGGYTKAVLREEIREMVARVNAKDMRRLRDRHGVSFPDFRYGTKAGPAPENGGSRGLSVADIVDYSPELVERLTCRIVAVLAKPSAVEPG